MVRNEQHWSRFAVSQAVSSSLSLSLFVLSTLFVSVSGAVCVDRISLGSAKRASSNCNWARKVFAGSRYCSRCCSPNEQYRIALLSPDGTGESVRQPADERAGGNARNRVKQASGWQRASNNDLIGNQSGYLHVRESIYLI